MAQLRAGWMIALCAGLLAGSAWLPWLKTAVGGGGHASAIGGTFGSLILPARFGAGQLIVLLSSVLIVAGAMVARDLSPRLAAMTALVIAVLITGLIWYYYRLNVNSPVIAGYGFYIGAVCAVGALVCSVWTLVVVMFRRPPRR